MKTLGLSAAESIERARARSEAKMRGSKQSQKYVNCTYDYLCYFRQLTNFDCKDLFFFSFLRSIHTNFYIEH